MEKRRLYIAVLLAFCFSAFIGSQNNVTVDIYPGKTITLAYEKFNLNDFSSKFYKSGSLDYAYTEADGTQVRVTCQRRGQPIEVYEVPPLPAVHRIFKEFYPNGNLKQKGLYLPQQFPVGKWLDCDQNGRCSVVDHEAGRGGIGYNGVLKILADYGFISGPDSWEIFVIWYNELGRQWGAKLRKGGQYKTLTIDAASGKVSNEFGYEITPSGTEVRGEYVAPE